MPQEAHSIGSSASNPSGIGAVYFDKPEHDLLSIHLNNLKQVDEAQQQRQRREQAKLATTQALLGDINPKIKGALETDIPELQRQTRELQSFLQQGLKQGFDPSNTSPQNQSFYQEVKNRSKQIELNALGSAAAKEMIKEAVGKLDPDKYDVDEFNKRIADFRSLGMAGRQKYNTVDSFLVPTKEGFGTTADAVFDKAKGTIYKTTEVPEKNQFGQIQMRKVKEADDSKLVQLANTSLVDPTLARQSTKAFADLPVDKQNFYIKLADTLTKVNPSNPTTPQAAMLYDRFSAKTAVEQTIEDAKFLPHVKAMAEQGAKKWAENQKGVALYSIVNGILENNPDVFINAKRGADGKLMLSQSGSPTNVNELVSTKLKGLSYGTRIKDGAIIPNTIVSVTKYIDNPDKIVIETDNPDNPTMTVDKSEFPEVLFNSNFDAGYDLLSYAAGQFADKTKQQIVSPEKTKQSGGVKPSGKVEKVTAETYDVGGKKVPFVTTAKSKSKEIKAVDVTQAFVDGLKEGDIVIVDGIERVKNNGVLKKVKK